MPPGVTMVQRENGTSTSLVIREKSDLEWQLAKQRASVRWLVAKAYNNQVPSNLKEPYYRDQTDGGERLKPQIVHALANAELYCSCMANIYADPNYHNLSHWGIIQALARKGVYVAEPSDVALTETVLIQTGPIKMSAHMAVMEAIMALYIREMITAERVVGVVRRFTALQASTELPADQEEALLLWINKACARLRGQIAAEVRQEDTVPRFPLQQDISDLSDGTCLAGLVSLYCPDELSWPEVAFSDPPRIADSLYNLQLVEKFCREALPYSPHFLSLEDILYMHSSVKQNLLVLLADLFYLFEINPAKCVRQPGMAKERVLDSTRRQEPYGSSPRRSQPELRRDSLSQAGSFSGGRHPHSEPSVVLRRSRGSRSADRGRQRFSMFEAAGRDSPSGHSSAGSRRPHSMYPADDRPVYRDDRSNSEESEFVVQRASGPMTLSRMAHHQRRSQSPPSSIHSDDPPSRRPLKERLNRDTKWEERGEDRRGAASECGDSDRNRVAGKPSPRVVGGGGGGGGGGRLSRRNSFSDESQLTVENFGGSQDNLQLLGRNPDKQPVVHYGRRESRETHRDLLKESNINFGDRDPFQEAEQDRATRSASRAGLYERSDSRQEVARPPSRNLFLQSDSIKEQFQPSGRRGEDPPRRDDRDDAFRPIDDAGSVVDIDNRVLDALEREARGDSPSKAGNNLVIMFDNNDEQKPTSFAELSKVQPRENAGGINIVYMQHEKEDRSKPPGAGVGAGGGRSGGRPESQSGTPGSAPRSNGNGTVPAAATTSWVQQQQLGQRHGLPASDGTTEPDLMASELHSIKLRLEEKRRNIEIEKRKMESAMNRQKQTVGKQAFLQAMGQSKFRGGSGGSGGGGGSSSSVSVSGSEGGAEPTVAAPPPPPPDPMVDSVEVLSAAQAVAQARPPTLQEVSQNMNHMKDKWGRVPDSAGSPDVNNLDYDQYTSSLHNMDASLTELQDDIQRLSQQQTQMQQMHNIMQNGGQTQAPYQQAYQSPQYQSPYPPAGPPPGQFYLHDQAGQRRQWGQPMAPEDSYQQHMSPGRARWGQPVRPMMPAMPQQYGPGPADPYNYSPQQQQQQQQQQQRPYSMHDQGGPGGYPGPAAGALYTTHHSPQHHRMDGGMMGPHGMPGQPPAGYHPDYTGYQQSPPPGPGAHYPPPPGSAAGGFRLHGTPPSRDPRNPRDPRDPRDSRGDGSQEPRELRAGQSPRMYGDYQYGQREEADGPRVPTVRRVERPKRRSPSPAVMHVPMPAPPLDDMEPQSVSFIGDQADGEAAPMRPPRRAERGADRGNDRGTDWGADRADRAEKESSPSSGGRTYRVPRAGQQDRREMSHSPGVGKGTFKVRRSPSPQREQSPAAPSPAWASRRSGSRAGSESPARPTAAPAAPPQEVKQEDQPAPEVLAAMKVDKIKQDADPEIGFVISFDDDAAPRKPKPRLGQRRMTPSKTASSGSLLDQQRPDIPPKPKPSAFSLSGVSGGGGGGTGAPSAFSTYTKWPRTARGEPAERTRRSPSPPRSRSSSPVLSPGGGLSLGRLSDPRRKTALPTEPLMEDQVDRAAPLDRPLLEKLEVDPNLPPETMKPLKPAQSTTGVGLVIGDELVSPKSDALDEMERKKERILMMSLKRKQDQETTRIRKEEEAQRRKEGETRKEEEKQRKKEEEKARKERIFEQYKLKKAIEEAEKNGTPLPREALAAQQAAAKPAVRPRPKSTPSKPRPKSMMDGGGGPGTPSRGGQRGSQSNLQHMSERPPPGPGVAPPPALPPSGGSSTLVRHRSLSRRRRSNIAVSTGRSKSLSRRLQTPEQLMYPDKGREGDDQQWGSNSSLTTGPRSRRGSNASLYGEPRYNRSTPVHSGRKAASSNEPGGAGGMRKDGHRTSTGSLSSAGRPRSRLGPRTGSSSSLLDDDPGYRRTAFAHSGRRQSAASDRPDVNRTFSKASGGGGGATRGRHQSLTNLFGTSGGTPRYSETDSGLGRDTPTRRGVSPGAYGGVTSPSGPGSLPPGLVSRRRNYGDDGASDTSSMASYDYNGPRLFKAAASKSNRSILLNAVEYCVFPGAVNREAKQRVLEEIARVETRHFLVLFRDARCQFRALYCYEPETEEVFKLYGTGPKMATDKMFDKFFKYNSGGKSFAQIHTKHLSVTIDAFTIHDALWQGKRPSLPSKKDMTLLT